MAASWPAFQNSHLFKLSRNTHKFYCTKCSPPGQGKARHMTGAEAIEHELSDPVHTQLVQGLNNPELPQPSSSKPDPHALTAARLESLGNSYTHGTVFYYTEDVNYQVAFWNRSIAGAEHGVDLRYQDFFDSLAAYKARYSGWEEPDEYEDVDDFGVVIGPTLPGAEVRKVKRAAPDWGSSGSDADWPEAVVPAQEPENAWGAQAPGWETTPAGWAENRPNLWDEYGLAEWDAAAPAGWEEEAPVNLWEGYDAAAAPADRPRDKRGGKGARAQGVADRRGQSGRQGGRAAQNKKVQPTQPHVTFAKEKTKGTQQGKTTSQVPPPKPSSRPRWFTEEVQI